MYIAGTFLVFSLQTVYFAAPNHAKADSLRDSCAISEDLHARSGELIFEDSAFQPLSFSSSVFLSFFPSFSPFFSDAISSRVWYFGKHTIMQSRSRRYVQHADSKTHSKLNFKRDALVSARRDGGRILRTVIASFPEDLCEFNRCT